MFIQQALSRINQLASNYSEVNATIWLTKGSHFFFYCDRLANYAPEGALANDTTVYDAAPLRHDRLC